MKMMIIAIYFNIYTWKKLFVHNLEHIMKIINVTMAGLLRAILVAVKGKVVPQVHRHFFLFLMFLTKPANVFYLSK